VRYPPSMTVHYRRDDVRWGHGLPRRKRPLMPRAGLFDLVVVVDSVDMEVGHRLWSFGDNNDAARFG